MKICPHIPNWQNMKHSGLVDLAKRPIRVILDVGCKRAMGYLMAAPAFECVARPLGIVLRWEACHTKMFFASSKFEILKWCVRVNSPTIPSITTTIDVHERGSIPILLSLPQMCKLFRTLELQPNLTVLLTCKLMGDRREPLPSATTKPVFLDLTRIKVNLPPEY